MLGFVGAGGIGLIYAENMRLWNWDVVMFITLLLVIVVMAMDTLSAWLRRRYIGGNVVPLFKAGNPFPGRAAFTGATASAVAGPAQSRHSSTGQLWLAFTAASCGHGLTSRTWSACRHSGRSFIESV